MPSEYTPHRTPSNALSRRAATAQTTIISVVVLLFSIAIIGFNAHRLNAQMEYNISGIATLAKTSLASAVWQVDHSSAQDFIDAVLQDHSAVFAQVITGQEVMASKTRKDFAGKPFNYFKNKRRFRTRTVEIRKFGDWIGTFNLAVSTDKIWRDIVINAVSSMALAIALILAISQTTLYFSRKRLFEPLKQLEESAMDIADGDLDATIDTDLPGELGNLARATDDMRNSVRSLVKDLTKANTRLEEHKDSLAQTVRDRTEELKRKNESLNQALEDVQSAKHVAEVANMAKSRFLASMSHEIRTPMNAILGMADILSETELTEAQAKYVGVFRHAGEGLLDILDNILDLSKIEAGRFNLVEKEFSISEVLEKTASLLQAKADEKGIEFTSYIDPNIPDQLTGDPTRLKQILINLQGNAIKFTEQGSIHTTVTIATGLNGIALQFSVSDTGVGIPAAKLSTIFDTFTQADDSTTRRYGGTGLGLAISKQLVRMMDGRIWAESGMGAGSTFYFTAAFNTGQVPVRAKIEQRDQAERDIPPLKILMLEDSKYNAFVIQTYLQSTDCELTIMGDGESGIDEFSRGVYDCILMDIQMPGMDGLEATRTIRAWEEEHQTLRTPIITMTAHSMIGDAEKCLEAGADQYISKPVKKTTLLEILSGLSPLPNHKPEPTEQASLMELRQLIVDAHSALKNQDIETIRQTADILIDKGELTNMGTLTKYGEELHNVTDNSTNPERVREILLALSEYVERSESL